MEKKMEYINYYHCPLGVINITSNERAITGLTMADSPCGTTHYSKILKQAQDWLECYFAGKKPEASQLPLELNGTVFQKKVWSILTTIPYGHSITYGQLAEMIACQNGQGKMSAQAVGQAVGANPIGIIVPCHRVLGANRRLTGYAWGLEKKVWLLDHEGIPYR